jgi:hypothetical protein
MPEEVRVEIGGIGLSLRFSSGRIGKTEEDALVMEHFIKEGRNDFFIEVKEDNPPEYQQNRILFQSGRIWRVFEGDGRVIFELNRSYAMADRLHDEANRPYDDGESDITHVCVMEKNLPKATMYIPRQATDADKARGWSLEPLMRGLGQLIAVSILHNYQGLLIHSAGIRVDGEGILFCGISGAGKTTLARLWLAKGVEVLSDDRVIVRKEKENYFIYGSPWPGDAAVVSSGKAPLRKIVFISKAQQNTCTPLETRESYHKLITQCFPAFWSRESMEFSLMFCRELAENIDCSIFGFVPDESAVEFVLRNKD